jgi:ATP-dependent RNA helicase DeaD
VIGPTDAVAFAALGVAPEILEAVAALGFTTASPIQAAAIPPLLQGRDVIGQSETGSGKTAAFCIPAIERVDPAKRSTQVLILAPTRELVTQITAEVQKLARFSRGIQTAAIYGGASYERQFADLKRGSQIVVGTPGRLVDHLERKTLRIDQLQMLILDESDRMLDMGFRDDIEKMLEAVPDERQTVFFSATLSTAIETLVRQHSRDPLRIEIARQKKSPAATVEQLFYEVRHPLKQEALVRILDFHRVRSGIVFCNTQQMVEELADTLGSQGFSSERLHGGMPQAQRTRVMDGFKRGAFTVLVATDVAARGIDVNDLELVVNYDLPFDPEDYVHRIGRTGRAGRGGRAVTLVSGGSAGKLHFIERFTGVPLQREKVPTVAAIMARRSDALVEAITATLDAGDFSGHAALIERLVSRGHDAADVAAAVLEHFAPQPELSDVEIDFEKRPGWNHGTGPRRGKGPPRSTGRSSPGAGKRWQGGARREHAAGEGDSRKVRSVGPRKKKPGDRKKDH